MTKKYNIKESGSMVDEDEDVPLAEFYRRRANRDRQNMADEEDEDVPLAEFYRRRGKRWPAQQQMAAGLILPREGTVVVVTDTSGAVREGIVLKKSRDSLLLGTLEKNVFEIPILKIAVLRVKFQKNAFDAQTGSFEDGVAGCPNWFLDLKYSPQSIAHRRLRVGQDFAALHGDWKELTPRMVADLFRLHDRYFFDNSLGFIMKERKINVDFKVQKVGQAAGFCAVRHRDGSCQYTLALSPVMNDLFSKGERSLKANGLKCANRLECIQIVFEHELTHLLLNIFCQDQTPHGIRFKAIVSAMYGHTSASHELTLGDADAKEEKIKSVLGMGLAKGDTVRWQQSPTKWLTGTVMVKPKANAKTVHIKSLGPLKSGQELRVPLHSITRL